MAGTLKLGYFITKFRKQILKFRKFAYVNYYVSTECVLFAPLPEGGN